MPGASGGAKPTTATIPMAARSADQAGAKAADAKTGQARREADFLAAIRRLAGGRATIAVRGIHLGQSARSPRR
jgi:hypothetical protein